MWSLKLCFLVGLAQLISSQNYDELLADVCFRKIYVCGDHRWSILGNNGHFVTEQHEFGEICRKHKKFIACVDDAVSNNCNESMSALARMTLNNRISLKMFCTDLEWRKSYFSSVHCINANEQKIKEECENEERVYVDDRPWWCLIPEPCDALQRVFDCSVQKMKNICGAMAAEVFRRMQNLNAENQDVVCEFRRQNPRYCRYERQKRHIVADQKESGTPSGSLHDPSNSEEMYNVVRAVLVDTIKNIDEQRLGFSDVIDNEDLNLRKLLSVKDDSSPNQVGNDSVMLKRSGILDDLKEYPDVIEIEHLRELTILEQLEFRKNSKVLKDLNLKLKKYLLDLISTLHSEEIIVGLSHQDFVEAYWISLEFPVQSMVCDRVFIASKEVFKCSIKWNHNEVLDSNMNNNSENQNSEFVSDPNFIANKDVEASNEDSTSPNADLFDIHRCGFEALKLDVDREEEQNFQDINEMTDSVTLESASEIPQTGFILIESPYSTEQSTEPSSTEPFTEFYSDLIEPTHSASDSVSPEISKTSSVEDLTESLQLREIEEAIGEILENDNPKLKSEVLEDYCVLDDQSKDCGKKGSVFTDHDNPNEDLTMQDAEDVPLSEDSHEENMLRRIRLKANLPTTTEDPFYEAIERLAMEDYEKRALEKEIESFLSEKEKMLAREREKKEIESFLKERDEMLAREREKASFAGSKRSSEDNKL